MAKRNMEMAVFWLVVIGPIVIGAALTFWFGGHKLIGIWVGFSGIVALLAAAALQLHQQTVASTQPSKDEFARAVVRSAEVAEQTLQVSEGARVHIFEWEARNIEANKSPLFRAHIANVGKSFATIIDDWSRVTVDGALPASPAYGTHLVAIQIPPGGGIFMEIDGRTPPGLILTEPHIEEIVAGKKSVFVWGRLTIRDVFGGIWHLGYAVKFAPVKGDDGKISWRDVSVTDPNYTFLIRQAANPPAAVTRAPSP